jgi:hypothetical protein
VGFRLDRKQKKVSIPPNGSISIWTINGGLNKTNVGHIVDTIGKSTITLSFFTQEIRIVLRHLLEIWDTIEELSPKGMRSYGSMPQTDQDDLAAIIEKLILQHKKLLKEVSSVNK